MVARSARRATRLAGLGVVAAALLASLAGCDAAGLGHFGWPGEGVTPDAHRMYDLWIGSVVAALAVGVFVWGLIFWCVVRYRKRGDVLPAQTRYNMPLEVLYSVIPVLVVSVLFYYTAVIQTDVDDVSKPPDMTVEVVGWKWNWQFNYRDGVTDTTHTASTVASTLGSSDYVPVLVLPVGKSIRIEETSRDVIHSFWVPELLFKRDVFPGGVASRNAFQTTIERPGSYVGRCAELCGTYHSMMNFELRAVSADEFDRFLAAKKEGKSTPDALRSIGQEPFATTSHPYPSKRDGTTGQQKAG